ncbi:proline-rich receptor-like protein kinase PERK3 [Neltuma alba]|uniref:proline-rich receptor-like protein kinase PERK3 n=1 Tax=Neltuma alba TaxID=207710 RepID=UPI0010A2DD12|nr:proline-rich receptor-like protein kinase PERK3 [Prosopis alba]
MINPLVTVCLAESNRIANFGDPLPVNNPRSTNNVRGRAPSRPKVVDIPRAAPRIFTYEELELATDGFSKSKKVGEGGFGTVYQGVLNNEFVAVKKPRSGANQGKQQLQTEIQVISQARHRHIVSLVGYYIDEDEERGKDMLLAYEFIPNGSLHSHLHGKGTKIIDWETRMKIAIGSAKGFAYLHEGCKPKIMHGDIKPHNILLLDDFQPKIADFGLAQLLSDSVTHVSMSQAQGTVGYLAPEYFEGKLSEKSDVYAFGVVLLGMITGRQPCDFRGALVKWATPRLIAALESRNFEALADPRLQNHYDPEEMFRMVSCAANCVCVSPAARPRMSKVVQALEGAIVLDNHLAEEAASRLQPQASMEAKREMALVTI